VSPPATDWVRPGADTLERGIYRIQKSHVSRLFGDPAPVYHAHAGPAFLGAAPDAEQAKDLCAEHETRSASKC